MQETSRELIIFFESPFSYRGKVDCFMNIYMSKRIKTLDLQFESINTLSQIEQIKIRPQTQLGSNTDQPGSTIKLFDELIQNARDNYERSFNKHEYYIKIYRYSARKFSIENNGSMFDLNRKDAEQQIKRIFSQPNSSSSYGNEQSTISSINGIGAKLANIFGKLFMVEIQNGYIYSKSVWRNQMQEYEYQKLQMDVQDSYFRVTLELLDKGTVFKIPTKEQLQIVYNFPDLPNEVFHYINDYQLLNIRNMYLNNKLQPRITVDEYLQKQDITDYVKFRTNDINIVIFDKGNFKYYSIINGICCTAGQHFTKIISQLKKLVSYKGSLQVGLLIYGSYPNMQYSSQAKTQCITNFGEIVFDKQVTQFIQHVLSQKTVSRSKKINLKKLHEATNVTKKNNDCTLIVTEGLSAANFFKNMSQYYQNFYLNHGVLPLQGKIENCFKYDSPFDMVHQEVINLLKIVGLVPFKHYTSLAELRYKHILIATDADIDGDHIRGLLFNLIVRFWPELVELGFLQNFVTPIVIADNVEYLTISDFQKSGKRGGKYYKGLGTFEKEDWIRFGKDFQRYVVNLRMNDLQETQHILNNLFGDNTTVRKELIQQFKVSQIDFSLIEDILNKQVVRYFKEIVYRAIPNFTDGLKDCQRKIVYSLMKNKKELKVASLSSRIITNYSYHHGDNSLNSAIIQMAQDIPVTNNCNLVTPHGSFGTRFDPQASAAPRYISVSASPWLDKLFLKDDEILYKYNLSDDGDQIEPVTLYPILPIQMLNGAKGIAAGWSTFMPNFTFESVLNYIRSTLQGKSAPLPQVGYTGYIGTVKIVDNNILVSEGKYRYDSNKKVLIVHDTAIHTANIHLREALMEKKLQFKQEIIPDQGEGNDLIIPGITEDMFAVIKERYLEFKCTLSNMTFSTQHGVQVFNSVQLFLTKWIEERLQIYKLRKNAQLQLIIKRYVIHYNQLKLKQTGVYKYFDQKEKLFKKLETFTSDQQLDIVHNSLEDCKTWLNTSTSVGGSYKYILNQSCMFYIDYVDDLDIIEKDYNRLRNASVQQMWLSDLSKIVVK